MSKNKELEEFHSIIKEDKLKESVKESKKVKIFFDGRQYNIRIPASIAHLVDLDPYKDMFEFKAEVRDDKISLNGKLIKNGKK